MKTKEEVIKEAYGEYWETVKNYIDENGWIKSIDFLLCNTPIAYEFFHNENGFFYNRPKSLQGIENNNGWIKIESEEDLPKIGEYDMSSFILYYWTSNGLYTATNYKNWITHYDNKLQVTHYRFEPIFNPKPPIY